jgi:hypothetical protein
MRLWAGKDVALSNRRKPTVALILKTAVETPPE